MRARLPAVAGGANAAREKRGRVTERKKKKRDGLLHGAKIEDYCLIGDCETAALVSREGSIDWLCWPTFSSGACFAALLGTRENGFWKLAPAGKIKAIHRQYKPHTLVVETTFETSDGVVRVTDFMPPRDEHSNVVRIVQGVRGEVAMRMDIAIRFDYGRTTPWVTCTDGELHAVAGGDMVVLRTKAPLRGENMTTVSDFTVRAHETVTFTLTSLSSLADVPPEIPAAKALAETQRLWTDWVHRNPCHGPYKDAIERSLITLKALTYRPSGGIVAAVTTSLPEKIGGARNWDYRYCWLRDTAFTLIVLMLAGYEEEAIAWRMWLLRAIAGAPDQVQTIYGILGERQIVEWEVDWLPGYKKSRPVRIGNAAVNQFQLDVFGEVAAALAKTPEAEESIRVPATALQAALVNHLCTVWQKPDEGIWETRGKRQHFTYSKVMAWVALDRAIKHHERYDGGGDIGQWRKVRDQIHKQVCEKGFNKKLNSFVQYYGSTELDASSLRIVMVGFLPPEDPRIRGTVEAIEKRLMKGGFVLRYDTRTSHDGLPPGEGVFLACSFWMVTNLCLIGRKGDAAALYERLLKLRNDVGLLSEEYDPVGKRLVGNFPQALTHIALIHAAYAISGVWQPEGSE